MTAHRPPSAPRRGARAANAAAALAPADRRDAAGGDETEEDGAAELDRLLTLLDALPAPLQPLHASAIDGFLCGVLLQPRPVPAAAWLPTVTDVEGRPAPPGAALDELQALVHRRHRALEASIAGRRWFDPWLFEDADEPESGDERPGDGQGGHGSDGRTDFTRKDLASADVRTGDAGDGESDDDDSAGRSPPAVAATLQPWVAGFAAAMAQFPALMALDDPALVEPLALLFLHLDPDELEDADALMEVMQTLEPPSDLAEAAQDVVQAVMLMADVTRPRKVPPPTGRRGTARASPSGRPRGGPVARPRRPRRRP